MQRAKSAIREIRQEATCRNPGELMALNGTVLEEVVRTMQVRDIFCSYRQ